MRFEYCFYDSKCALQFSLDLWITKVIVEGDSQLIINSLISYEVSLASLGLLIQDAKIFA